MVKIVAIQNPITKEQFETEIDSGQTIATAFPDLSGQVQAVINGRPVPKEEYADCLLRGEDYIVFVRVPAGGDGGDKNVLRTAAFLALAIGATVATAGLGGAFVTASGGLSVLGAGTAAAIQIGGSFLINSLIPPPSLSQSSDTGAFKRRGALTGSRNQLAPYAPVPRVYGHMRVYPTMAGKPFTEVGNNVQYLHLLFNLGEGPLSLSNPKIGETEIGSFDINNNFTSNDTYKDIEIDVAEEPDHYTQDVDQQKLSFGLNDIGDSYIATTVTDTDEMGIELTFPRGLFDISTGDVKQYFVEFMVEYRAVGDIEWINPLGTETQYTEEERGERSTREFEKLWKVTSSAKETYRSGFKIIPDQPGQYEVRITRPFSGGDASTEDGLISDCVWSALRSVRYEKPTNLPGTVQIGMKIKATDQLNGVLDSFNVEAKSILSYYDGSSWSHPETNPDTGANKSTAGGKVTSEPAWIVADIFCGKQNQEAIPYDRLDGQAFKDWADAYGSIFEYNAVIDSISTVQQLSRNVAAAGKASIGNPEGNYIPVLDEANQTAVQMFNPRNSSDFSISGKPVEELHGLKVRFNDETNGWKETERIVYNDNYSEDGTPFDGGFGACDINAPDASNCKEATKFTDITFDGVTDPEQVWRLARYKLAERTLRPATYTYKTDIEHLIARRGDVVYQASDVVLWGSSFGRLKAVGVNGQGQVDSLTLDETVLIQSANDYNVRIRRQDGSFTTFEITNSAGDANVLSVTPQSADINPGDLFHFGIAGDEDVRLKVAGITPGPNLSATLTLVDEAPDIHEADSGTIPAYNPNITLPIEFDNTTPPAPVIDSVRSDHSSLYKDEDGTFRLRMLVSFSISQGNQTTEIEARYRAANSPEGWVGIFKADANLGVVSLPDVARGKDYIIQIRSRYKNNVSEWVELSTAHTVQGKKELPPNVAGFTATVDKTQIRLNWNPVEETDNDQYEVRKGSDWGTGTFVDKSKRTNMTDQIDTTGTITYWIKAIDTSGNYSQVADSASVTIDPKYDDDPLYPGEGGVYLDDDNTWTGSNVFEGNTDFGQQYTDFGMDYAGSNIGFRVPRSSGGDAYNYFDATADRWGQKFGSAGGFDPFILESDIFPDGDFQNLGMGDIVNFAGGGTTGNWTVGSQLNLPGGEIRDIYESMWITPNDSTTFRIGPVGGSDEIDMLFYRIDQFDIIANDVNFSNNISVANWINSPAGEIRMDDNIWLAPNDGSVLLFAPSASDEEIDVQFYRTDSFSLLANTFNVDALSTFADDTTFNDQLSSPNFVSGFAGAGWLIDPNFNGAYAEFDNLTIRERFRVYELLINQIRATNGSVWVSSSAKIKSVSNQGSGVWRCFMGDSQFVPFLEDDLVIAQRFTGTGEYLVEGTVGAIENGEATVSDNSTSRYFDISLRSGSDNPTAGMDLVRVGNTSDVTRQGAIYLTADDSGAPYMDVIDGVDSFAARHDTGKTKARLGNLAGITDVNFGALSGYGLYSQNVYLKGQIQISAGSKGIANLDDAGTLAGKDHADWNSDIIGSGKPANNADVTSAQFSDSLNDIENGSAYSRLGLNASGYVQRIIRGSDIGATGSLVDGLNMTGTYVGFYDSGNGGWQNYMKSDGSGQFAQGNMGWNAAGEAFFTGSVTVTGGNASSKSYASAQANAAQAVAEGYADTKIFQYTYNQYDGDSKADEYSPKPLVAKMTVYDSSWPYLYGTVVIYWNRSDEARMVLQTRTGRNYERQTYNSIYPNWTDWDLSETDSNAQVKADSARNAARDNLASKLGYDDYSEMYDLAADGHTLIQGGLVTLDILDAHGILADVGTFTDFLYIGPNENHILDGKNNTVSFAGGLFTAGGSSIQGAGWDWDSKRFYKIIGDNKIMLAADSTSLSSTNSAAEPGLFSLNASNGILVNVGNIYKSKTRTGIAVFDDYHNNSKIFEASKDDNGNLYATLAGANFDKDAFWSDSKSFEGTGSYLNWTTNQFSISDTFSVDDGVLTAVGGYFTGYIEANSGSLKNLDIMGELEMQAGSSIALPQASNGNRGRFDAGGLTLPAVSDQSINFAYSVASGIGDATMYADEPNRALHINAFKNNSSGNFYALHINGFPVYNTVYAGGGQGGPQGQDITAPIMKLAPNGGMTIDSFNITVPYLSPQDGMRIQIINVSPYTIRFGGGNIRERQAGGEMELGGYSSAFFTYVDSYWYMSMDAGN